MEMPGEVRQRAASTASRTAGAWRRPMAPLPPQQPTAAPTTSGLGFADDDSDVAVEEAMLPMAATGGKQGRPCGLKIAKEEQRAQKEREHALRA
jgi:hypothetical protein